VFREVRIGVLYKTCENQRGHAFCIKFELAYLITVEDTVLYKNFYKSLSFDC
jgi:hypothetical protein